MALAVLVAALAAGCAGRHPGTASGAGSLSAAGSDVVLADSARELRAQIDSVVAAATSGQGVKTVLVDDAAPCAADAHAAWPRRWGYTTSVTLDPAAALARARVAADILAGQGWQLRRIPTTSDAVDVEARRGGMLLRVGGGLVPGTLTVEGYGLCIGQDGSAATE